jgi:tetratricopeptide (TPR) repeat protein
VTRLRFVALFISPFVAAIPLFPQAKPEDPKLQDRKPQTPPPDEQEPPEEDVTMKPKEYTFNPLQAEKESKIGDYYFKKGSYRAAAGRFEEATKWNPGMADAYFKLGEAKDKMKDKKSARLAFQKYLELEPDGKEAPRAKKALGGK